MANEKIKVLWNRVVEEVLGDDKGVAELIGRNRWWGR